MAATPATKPFPTAAEAARVAEFRVALRRFQRQTEIVARATGITPSWYQLLLQIKGAPDLTEQTTVTALASRLQLAQSSVTELVSRAEHAGLLERAPSTADAEYVAFRRNVQRDIELGASPAAALGVRLRAAGEMVDAPNSPNTPTTGVGVPPGVRRKQKP